MTDKKIMEAVLKKIDFPSSKDWEKLAASNTDIAKIQVTEEGDIEFLDKDGEVLSLMGKEILIFSHWFAKEFWKDDKDKFNITWQGEIDKAKGHRYVDAWVWHLMHMTTYKNPVRYLRLFVEYDAYGNYTAMD